MNSISGATVYGVKVFFAGAETRAGAHIVNLSSVFGIFPAGQCAYSASKNLPCGVSRSRCARTRRPAMCAFPAFIPEESRRLCAPVAHWRRCFESKREKILSGFERLARTPPKKAAARILLGVERSEPRILIGSGCLCDRHFPAPPADVLLEDAGEEIGRSNCNRPTKYTDATGR